MCNLRLWLLGAPIGSGCAPLFSAAAGDRELMLTNQVATLADRCEKRLNSSVTEEDFLVFGITPLEFYQQIRA